LGRLGRRRTANGGRTMRERCVEFLCGAGARAIGGGRTRATTRARSRDRARWDGNVWREARAGDFKDDDDARLTDAMMRLTRVG
jgi:hypothetical protein